MAKSGNWVIAAVKIDGVINTFEGTNLFRFLKGWDGNKPSFGIASAYKEDGPPLRFERDEAEIEAKLIQMIGGDNFHVFAVPCPTMTFQKDASWA